MARARQSQKTSSKLSDQVARTVREGALWVFIAFSLILWFALFTYDPVDPGFSHAGSSGEINNGVGRIGALMADLLLAGSPSR